MHECVVQQCRVQARASVSLCVGFVQVSCAPTCCWRSHGFPCLPEILDFCFFFSVLFERNSLIVRGNDTNNTISFSKLPSASKSEIEVSETLTPIVFSSTTFSCVLPLALAPGQVSTCVQIFSLNKSQRLSATSDSMLLPATFGDGARVPKSISSLSSENDACRVEREATSMSMIDGGDGSRHILSFLQVSLLQIFIFTSDSSVPCL